MENRFAIFVLVVSTVGGLSALRWARRHRTGQSWRCPGCLQQVETSDFGRFVCGACRKDFVLDYRGRPASSLGIAVGPWAALWTAALGWVVWRLMADRDWWSGLHVLLVAGIGCWMIVRAWRRKRFGG